MKKRRASDILEECISQVFSGQETIETALAKYPEYADEIRPELEAALWLHRRRAAASVRPGFVAASSKRLVSQLKQESRAPVPAPRFRWDPALLGLVLTAVFVFVSIFAFRGGLRVIEQALPGDPGYSLKLGIENAQLSLASTPAEEAALRIDFAARRVREVEGLIEQEQFAEVPAVLAAYRQNVTLASDLITGLEDAPVLKAELAQNLAMVVAENTEVFSTMLATVVDLPVSVVVVLADTLTFGDETIMVMAVVLDELGQDLPAGVTLKPTATIYSSPTSTDQPTNTPQPTSTPQPTRTLVPTFTLEPTATWDPRTPTLTATWDPSQPTPTATLQPPVEPNLPAPTQDDDGDDEVKPTKKPKKPTKTPKDK